MLENNIDDLGIEYNFTIDQRVFDQFIVRELVEGGTDKIVTQENKKEYIKALAKFKLTDEIKN
jgi:hypothetical protein